MTRSLFEDTGQPRRQPLAERMRPVTLDDYVGQTHLLGAGKPLRVAIERDQTPSMVLWGPPGVGKTTLARIIARQTRCEFVPLSAVLSGIKEVKEVMAAAERLQMMGRRTILFVDEIHRFNKAQQDAFLPYVENGSVTLIGATTENPSFEVISALLSRLRVFVLQALSDDEVLTLLRRARSANEIAIEDAELKTIAGIANGDARTAYNILELALEGTPEGQPLDADIVREAAQRSALFYDKGGEEHFNIISALHKSLRNSDADAALYWLARMLEAGEDPLYVARRLVRFASEDIGLADPAALRVALDAKEAFEFVGLPEGKLALAQCVVYLAAAPKSNAIYTAYAAAAADVAETRSDPVPLHLRNAPTRLMKGLCYGKGYQYSHDEPDAVANMECLPESLKGRRYYQPKPYGAEPAIGERLDAARSKIKGDPAAPRD